MLKYLTIAAALIFASPLAAEERYEGYYYPEISSSETFERVISDAPPASRGVRVDFVTNLTIAQLAAPESPRFVFFAKGSEAETLVVVALDDEVFRTLYRARAILAQMTSNVRQNDIFRQESLKFTATFFDLLQLLEFETMVISDGDSWAHQVTFIRN